MEKARTFFGDITEFLGPKENRYFSNGFKNIDIVYNEMKYCDGTLFTSIKVQLVDNWSKKKGENLKPHIGTTEFISIAAVTAQQLMESALHLSQEDIQVSWISRLTFKIKKCEYADYNAIPVLGKVLSTNQAGEKCVTSFNIQIGSLSVGLNVCHPPKSSNRSDIKIGTIDLYKMGYRLRDHKITNVALDEKDMTTLSSIRLQDSSVEKKGIGAKYAGIILTDYILITGQLIQALLYNLNGIDRENSNNLWLREVDAFCETPPTEVNCNSQVKFANMNIVQKDGDAWQSVVVMSNIGNITSKIKVAQKLN